MRERGRGDGWMEHMLGREGGREGGRRRGKRVHTGLWSPTPVCLRRRGSSSIARRASARRASCLVVVKLVLVAVAVFGVVVSFVGHNVPNMPARARVYTRGHSSLAIHVAFHLPPSRACRIGPNTFTSAHPSVSPPLCHSLCHTQAAPSWTSPHTTSTTCGGC